MIKNKAQVELISHGSHTVQKNCESSIIASKSIGLGLTYSYQKGINLLSQSIYNDHFLDSINLDYSRINYLISKTSKDYNLEILKNNKKTKILYIGTVKSLGARRYYRESSPEFFGSIEHIYKKLKKFRDLNLSFDGIFIVQFT